MTTMTGTAKSFVRVLQLPSLVPWRQAARIQRALVDSYTEDQLVLCEHPPTYTGGRRNTLEKEQVDRLRNLSADVHESKRGGQLTFHGPGQLVGYPVLNVRKHGGVRCYVHKLEETLIRVCGRFGIEAGRSPHTGVWVGDGKIAAIGVQVSRGISWHGFALNCNTDLSWFDHIVPCGIEDKTVTSISKELGRDVGLAEVAPVAVECFGEVFGSSMCAASAEEVAAVMDLATAPKDTTAAAPAPPPPSPRW